MYFIFLNRHRKQTLGLWVTESGPGTTKSRIKVLKYLKIKMQKTQN